MRAAVWRLDVLALRQARRFAWRSAKREQDRWRPPGKVDLQVVAGLRRMLQR